MSELARLRARIPHALVRFSVGHPKLTLLLWLGLSLATTPFVMALRVDTSTDSVLAREDPEWQRYQESQDLFGGDEIIVIALRGDAPYAPGVMREITRLSDELEQLDGVRRVDSLSTVAVVHVTPEGELELTPALKRAPDEDAALSQYVEQRLRGDRIAPRNLVSADGRVFAINVVLERGVESNHAELLAEMHALVDPTGGILSGVPVFRVESNRRTGSEILFFAPLTAGLIALFLFVVFRSGHAVLLGTTPGILGSWLLVAAMGSLDSPLSITTMILPSVIMALGCAYAMHLLAAGSDVDTGMNLEERLRDISLPVALSGLTTAIGFLSIALVRIDAVRFTGAYGALGVLVVTAASLTLIPAALTLSPLPAQTPRGFERIREELGPWLVGIIAPRRRLILLVWGALTLTLALGITRLDVETDATRWFPSGNPVRDHYDEIRLSLSGISPLNLIIESPEGRSVLEPETLAAIDALTAHMNQHPDVGKAISVADPLRQINGGFQSDPSLPLPDTLPMASQYLLLLESLEQLEDLISFDRRHANIQLRVDNNGSTHLMRIAEEAAQWWEENGVPDHSILTTGIMYEFARAENEIAYGQLKGLTLALVVISSIIFAIFRWPRLAFVTLIPNAIPLILIFGTMGILGIPLDAGTVLIGGLALGVAVDDTIHITTGFWQRTMRGESSQTALARTFSQVLPAILASTLMISVAFLVLGLSEFTPTRNLGLLTGGIMTLCLLADVTLLAALLLGPSLDRNQKA